MFRSPMRRLFRSPVPPFALSAALLATAAAFTFGGWAVITIDELPDYATVGKPLNLTYVARQHGVEKLDKLTGDIEARSGKTVVRATVRENPRAHYTASITLPHSGAWTITVNSGFGPSNAKLIPLQAVDAGAAPPEVAQAERGRRLFVAKGCVTCHVHSAVSTDGMIQVKAGPDLTEKRYAADYLKMYLADPSIRPPSTPNGARMPNLGLKPAEVAAIAAFVNGKPLASANGAGGQVAK
jgi:hypothetical protein